MAFLSINGVVVRVADASVTQTLARRLSRSRSFRGELRDARRAIRRSWTIEARNADHADGRALEQMIEGQGHLFDLADGLQGSTGLMPEAGLVAGLTLKPALAGAFGDGYLEVAAAVTGTVLAYDVQVGDEWTVLVRRKVAGAWVGYAQRSDGAAYVDGAWSSTFGLPFSIGGLGLYVRATEGVVELVKDSAAAAELLDDLVILPYRMSDAMLATLTASTAPKFGGCPVLRIEGDLVGETAFGLGNITETEIVEAPSQVAGVGWVNNARIVRFRLDLLDETFLRSVSLFGA
jgi:hypothetical protein